LVDDTRPAPESELETFLSEDGARPEGEPPAGPMPTSQLSYESGQ
jgi:hypothetical protein